MTATDAALIALGERFEKLLLEHMDAWLEWAPRMRAAHAEVRDNMAALAKDKDGRQIFDEAAENYRKKYNHADKSNIAKTPWQPLNTTSGNVSPMVSMYKEDYERAVMLEGASFSGSPDSAYALFFAKVRTTVGAPLSMTRASGGALCETTVFAA